MPFVFKHPKLPDYFQKVAGVRADTPPHSIPSIVGPYEHGRVLHFRDLKFDIDHDFWASLPTEGYRGLKKLPSCPDPRDFAKDPVLDNRLKETGLPASTERRLRREIRKIYGQVLPVYEALFGGYSFVRRQIVWRLNTIRNENLHIDTYATDIKEHFARLFINLDNQPRIWMTSYNIDELFRRFADHIPVEVMTHGTASEVRTALNAAAFGGRSTMWWDRQPRHVAYFEPGEVWAVESRQVAHQIFYGRRAVSFDFWVDPASMARPKRHYLSMAERSRRAYLAERSPRAQAAE